MDSVRCAMLKVLLDHLHSLGLISDGAHLGAVELACSAAGEAEPQETPASRAGEGGKA